MSDAMSLVQASIMSLENMRADSVFDDIMMQAGLIVPTPTAISNDAESNDMEMRPKRARTQSTMLAGSLIFSTLGHDNSHERP